MKIHPPSATFRECSRVNRRPSLRRSVSSLTVGVLTALLRWSPPAAAPAPGTRHRHRMRIPPLMEVVVTASRRRRSPPQDLPISIITRRIRRRHWNKKGIEDIAGPRRIRWPESITTR